MSNLSGKGEFPKDENDQRAILSSRKGEEKEGPREGKGGSFYITSNIFEIHDFEPFLFFLDRYKRKS